ncbi:hypothetical protein HPB50_013655 [Hyalomma asiaticum]|uniref:Uncharacterized protein n=1 Tax=Hyalomma asiaticum TaxID=266040 RepID=A0ACB7SYK4_HYAAI|nr:hypothetical protein HPB50_013655 [Hyalomma asiaticum]
MGGNSSPSTPSVSGTEEVETHHSGAQKTSSLVIVLVVAAALSVLAVTLMGLVLRSATTSEVKTNDDKSDVAERQGFCCKDEAAQVASALNSSGDVCEDFYGYVCSRQEEPSANYMSPMFHIFMKWRLVQMLRLSSRRSDAGALMAALRSGLAAKQAPLGLSPVAVVNMTSAIATWAKGVLRVTDVTRFVRFFAEASLRYGLPSVVSFIPSSPASDGSPSTLSLVRNDECDTVLASRIWTAAAALQAFNKIWSTTVEVEHVVNFGRALSKLRNQNNAENVTVSLTASPFLSLTNNAWSEIVSEYVSPVYPSVGTIRQIKSDRLNEVLGAIANAANREVATAYVVTCTSLNTCNAMHTATEERRTGVQLPSCEELAVCELEEEFKAEAVSTQKADEYVRDFFAHVVDNVAARAVASSTPGLFSSRDKKKVIRYLKEMKVMLPKEIVATDLRVPKFNASHSFAENLLLARSYSFDLRKARVAARIPSVHHLLRPEVVMRDSVVFVPSNLYMLLKINASAIRSVNVPAIGVGMAMEVWSFLLQMTTWSQETLVNIEAWRKCFRGTQQANRNEDNDRSWLKVFSLSLAFASVIDPQRQQGWSNSHTVGRVTLTEGQLSYLLWVYNHCDSFLRFLPEKDINLAIRNSPTFADAFECLDGGIRVRNTTCLQL